MATKLKFNRRNIVFQLPPNHGLQENWTNGDLKECEVDDTLAKCLLQSNDVSLAETAPVEKVKSKRDKKKAE